MISEGLEFIMAKGIAASDRHSNKSKKLSAHISNLTNREERANSKSGEAMNFQSPLPGTHSLQEGHTS